MGYGDIVAQAVQSTQADMAQANAAAQAIVTAVGSAKPWITDQTWTGNPARQWCGDWNGFYQQLMGLLDGQLPNAETQVVNKVRTQMERQAANAAQKAQTK
jgi:hypothetical protein